MERQSPPAATTDYFITSAEGGRKMAHTHHAQQTTYGVLVGRVQDGKMDTDPHTPHYEILVSAHGQYRIAVNVQSSTGSDVLAFLDQNFTPPAKLDLPHRVNAGFGFTELTTGPGGQGLDYLRDNLFPLGK